MEEPKPLYYHKPTSHSLLLFNSILGSLASLQSSFSLPQLREWYEKTSSELSSSLCDDLVLLHRMVGESVSQTP